MSLSTLIARCPAKVNLSLRVIGRRADGYHELDTVFQAIDLWDVVAGTEAPELALTCECAGVPQDESNLVLRAARLLRERFAPIGRGAALVLRKAIPVGAGLGGGSSDAAGALLLCERLWGLSLPRAELAAIGAEIGADVPFFLHGGTARGRERGDRIEALPYAGDRSLVLGFPPFGLSTREVFERYAQRLTRSPIDVSVPLHPTHKWPKENDFGLSGNDLEDVVFRSWPELESFRDALLEAGAERALLSGSGSTVFGIFDDARELGGAVARLRGRFEGWSLVTTRTTACGVRLVRPAADEGDSERGL